MTINEFIRYEKMAKLDLSEQERKLIYEQAVWLLDSFAALSAADTGGVSPLVSVVDQTNILREDVAEKNFSREEILAAAPEQYDGFFQVPKTLE